ncbi:hypothetical protein [Thermoleptolyngbya sp. C42_A2020_037]|uniref:preATP grasp domain-containing protein n=1 Tax=Thermoleptolyngbya sp. C42_A2020_037 TaxID=2747799 RepID=UPI001A0195E9|nr:hypothetical protein [Thermoleptolyngbya sp. C42_A2020_037]MBF2086277.1 hypothetical protein [Thermoleptolyngbya sp. C42_A2020_037]
MLASTTPLVILGNTLEANGYLLYREPDLAKREALIRGFRVANERSLLWLGDRKLVITEAPVAHVDYLQDRLGYSQLQHACPEHPSDSICADILREPALLQRIVDFADDAGALQLIPYATTPAVHKLADLLRQAHGLTVYLPESPAPDRLWLREYVQTKLGFRMLVGQWMGNWLPEGYVARSVEEAGAIAHTFLQRGQGCIVKANTGFLGIGHTVFRPEAALELAEICATLQQNPYYAGDLLIVEALIPSAQGLSPSAEVVVPANPSEPPYLIAICAQQVLPSGAYAGEMVSPDWSNAPWYADLSAAALEIAQKLRAMGYIGHFDLDGIVDDAGTLYLLEVNARRTGGTHVYELAQFLLGERRAQTATLLSCTSAPCPAVSHWADLERAIADLLFPQPSGWGVVITNSAALDQHQVGYVVLAASQTDALKLQQTLLARLAV